jgi:hypothetical protein
MRRRKLLPRKMLNTVGRHYIGYRLWDVLAALWRLFR